MGVNGFTTDDLIEQELPRLRDAHADFATLAIGANDIVHGSDEKTYRGKVAQILDAIAREVPRCRIVVLPQPDWSRSPVARSFGSPEALNARIRSFNAILAEEANSHGARFVDLFPLMTKQAEAKRIADDGLHPSADAYAEWSDAVAGALDASPLAATCP